jgi:dihydroneopterin aldolase
MFVQTIALKEVKFYAFHGFYSEEQLTGNHFLVDVEVTFVPNGDTEDLNLTVNYEVINAIVAAEMKNTQKLLETVVRNIIDQLLSKYPFISTAVVGIKKLHPPMPGEIGHSFVQLSYTTPK